MSILNQQLHKVWKRAIQPDDPALLSENKRKKSVYISLKLAFNNTFNEIK
jgi:hypothetical protein